MPRARIEINWQVFDKLCMIQATQEEIANILDVSVDTIERAVKREKRCGFAEYYKKKAAGGRMSLRRKQMEVANAGNVTMLIWMGKQYLGQKDRVDEDSDEPIEIVIKRKSND